MRRNDLLFYRRFRGLTSLDFVRPHIKDIFQAVSAKTSEGEPCCDWVGSSGAGHYVKMVHNGIEYGDMQIIAEAYQIMKDVLSLNTDQMADVFTEWNQGELDSFLIQITMEILRCAGRVWF